MMLGSHRSALLGIELGTAACKVPILYTERKILQRWSKQRASRATIYNMSKWKYNIKCSFFVVVFKTGQVKQIKVS